MVLKKKYRFPLVEIIWDDAESGIPEWILPDDIDTALPTVTTVGFLVKESDSAYVIASTITADHINGQFKIPKAMVKEYKVLK